MSQNVGTWTWAHTHHCYECVWVYYILYSPPPPPPPPHTHTHSPNTWITSDSTLTLTNLCTALAAIEHWYHDTEFTISDRLGVSPSKQREILQQYQDPAQYRQVLLHLWLTTHPAPSWKVVAAGLYRMRRAREHSVLRDILAIYIRGMAIPTCMYICM